jgi:hypothetical protein
MKRTIIACNIFEAELRSVIEDLTDEVEMKWLPAGLHCDLELLEKRLVPVLEESKGNGAELRLLFGNGCLPQMKELAETYQVPLLSAKNCVEALLGEGRLRELEKNRTMVITPAWIRKVYLSPEGVQRLLGWDNTDFKINFGRYERFLVLDAGLEPLSDEEILEFFDLAEIPIETEVMDLGRFKEIITEFLA